MWKNNYFLNLITPSAHISRQRNILYYHNVDATIPAHIPIDPSCLKFQLLADLRKDTAAIFKTELCAALGEDLSSINI